LLPLLRHVRAGFDLAGAEPRLSVGVTLGFLSVASLVAFAGSHPAPLLIGVLLCVALVQELPRALLARWTGRSAKVSIDVLGGNTEVTGPASSAKLALGLATVGSLFSVALGGLYLLNAHRLTHAPAAAFVSEAGRLHVVWGMAHLLPLAPFKLGALLASHCQSWARVKHAIVSLAFAVTLVCSLLGRLESPLVFTALLMMVWACGRNLLQAVAAARDGALKGDERLLNIEALTLAGETSEAVRLAQELLLVARSAPLQARVRRALAWAAIGQGDAALAAEALFALPPSAVDLYLLCAYLGTCGRAVQAIELLEAAREHGVRSTETTKLLVDFYYRERRFDAVSALALNAEGLLSAADLAQIEDALANAQPASPDRAAVAAPRGVEAHVLLPGTR